MTLPSAKTKSKANQEKYKNLSVCAIGINKVRHDFQTPRVRGGGTWPYLSRFYNPRIKKIRGLPETVRFGGDKSTVVLSRAWQEFFAQKNHLAAENYLKRLQSGWVNYGPWPKIEQLCCASPNGTYVVVYKIEGGKAYFYHYDNGKVPGDYQGVDFLQLFGVIYTDDSISLPDPGLCYTFPISNPGKKLWMYVDDLTFIRPLNQEQQETYGKVFK